MAIRQSAPPPALHVVAARASGAPAPAGARVLALYTGTMLLGAGLLFLVQPMFARMVLPLLGGSPAVWNTNVVFYQVVLLGGYAYSHVTTRFLSGRKQLIVHGGLVLLPLLVLPIAVPGGWDPPSGENPVPWLLALLGAAVGLPFFVVSTTSPLLQSWFARSGHRTAGDPYFLYAASNAGSMIALVAYPALVEPRLRLAEQGWVWTIGYGALVVGLAACGAAVWRREAPTRGAAPPSRAAALPALANRRRLRWVGLAAIPTSLMISVTTYLTTNIAPLPLLWILPLSLYLLTFILVFSSRTWIPRKLLIRSLPFIMLPLVIATAVRVTSPIEILIPLHLAMYFAAAMICHGALADDRPATGHLTEFYLWMSVGGAVGGLFAALIAPVVFDWVWEYPIALAMLCLLAIPGLPSTIRARRLDIALPIALTAGVAALVFLFRAGGVGLTAGTLVPFLGIAAFGAFVFSRRPVRFAMAVAGIFAVGALFPAGGDTVLLRERNFFGVKEVRASDDGAFHLIVHGDTVHGVQSTDPARQREPLAYYTRTGPLGDVFEMLRERGPQGLVVGGVGLGAGAIACYAQPADTWSFYEIDPAVVRIAKDPRYFSFLSNCTPNAGMIIGDARLRLEESPDASYDLLVLDAYSSDSVPVHLLTREAMALYLAKLRPGGVLAFHLSNRWFDLRPVVANLAAEAGATAWKRDDAQVTLAEIKAGKTPSLWMVVSGAPADVGDLATDPRWQPVAANRSRPWTDDFSSLLSVIRLR
ncbi:MAG: spermidine synthase [Dehalococcoidia bacterium]